MSMHEERKGPNILFVEPEPGRDILGQTPPYIAMIFFLALAKVVEQHGQVQEVLPLDAAIDLPIAPWSWARSSARATASKLCSSTVYLWY